jgi:hypothetical protein
VDIEKWIQRCPSTLYDAICYSYKYLVLYSISLPLHSMKPTRSMRFVKAFRTFRTLLYIAVTHNCTSGISGIFFSLVWGSVLSTTSESFLSEMWKPLGLNFQPSFPIFLLGISIEISAYALWLVVRILTKREDGPFAIVVSIAQLSLLDACSPAHREGTREENRRRLIIKLRPRYILIGRLECTSHCRIDVLFYHLYCFIFPR